MGDWKSADPDNPALEKGDGPQRPLFGRDVLLGKEALELLLRSRVGGTKAVAGEPVAERERPANLRHLEERAGRLENGNLRRKHICLQCEAGFGKPHPTGALQSPPKAAVIACMLR